jgi:pimeloyl-ACP methyl ester carboxylesterase
MVFDPALATPELIDDRFAASRAAHPEIREVPPNQGNLKPDLGRVQAPTLLLWGREDRFIPLEWALTTLREIENAELRVIPHCGHWVQYEQREYFNRAVREFFGDSR